MNQTRKHTLLVLMLALLGWAVVWGAFGFLVYQLNDTLVALEEAVIEKETTSKRYAYAATLHTLARDTEAERQALDSYIIGDDVVETLELLRQIGRAAGVAVSIDAVSSGGERGEAFQTLDALEVILRARGEFEAVFHYLSLLETLPLGLSVSQMELSYDEGEWTLLVQTHMLSRADATGE